MPLFLAKVLKFADQAVEFVGIGAAAMHPAIQARRAPKCGIGMAADQDRDRRGRGRAHLRLGNVVELAVELEIFTGGESFDDFDAFVNPLAALGKGHTHQLVVFRPWTGAHAQPYPIADQRGQ